jgi:hypothetical protein
MMKHWRLWVLATWVVPVFSQTIPVGAPFFENRVRDLQLLGRVNLQSSFCVRPTNYNRSLGLVNLYSATSLALEGDTVKKYRFQFVDTVLMKNTAESEDKKYKYRLVQALPFVGVMQYNGHHPYGWQDGLRIPNKGAQIYMSGGFEAYNAWLDLRFQPEILYAQNLPFDNPPYRVNAIDMPDRFGLEPYKRFHWGQSHAYIHIGSIDVGFGSENLQWGPCVKNAIILSNNAPGFTHGSIKTNKPIKTRWGSLEFAYVAGNLKRSGLFPYSTTPDAGQPWPYIKAKDIVYNGKNKSYDKLFNGYMASFQPKWLPGLYLGATRVLLNDTVYGKAAYLRIISKSPRFLDEYGPGVKVVNDNQLVSLFARWVMPESHAELYIEWGRDDFFWDIEDFLTQPEWTSVYTMGFQKIVKQTHQKDNEYYKVSAEITRLTSPSSAWSRGQHGWPGYYSHGAADHTHEGQVLGAGIGPGSNMQWLQLDKVEGFRTRSLSFERVQYKIDMFYWYMTEWRLGNPYKSDDSKLWVDWGIAYIEQRKLGHSIVRFKVQALKTYNYNWWYKLGGQDQGFRFPGLNVWSVNSEIALVHQF